MLIFHCIFSDLSINRPLRFSESYYLGSIDSSNITMEAITLQVGYSASMNYSLTGGMPIEAKSFETAAIATFCIHYLVSFRLC